jgi:hypothetical protein
LEFAQFSVKSDVWSMGVVLWELFTSGMVPYTGMSNVEVLEYLRQGRRLEKPATCPEEVYHIMLQSWNQDPQKRPTFEVKTEMYRRFNGNSDLR